MTHSQRRVVITGLGVVAPIGIGKEAFWQATSSGHSGITPFSPDTSSPFGAAIRVVGIIHQFAAEQFLERKLLQRTDRMTHLALSALREAIDDAGLLLEQENPQRVGAVIANTIGGCNFGIRQLQALYTRGPRAMSAYTAIAWLQVANVGQAAIRYNIQGYCKTPVNDAVGGLDALAMACGAIRRGAADVIFAGGSEAFLHPVVLQIMALQGQCYSGDDPHGYRPFDRRAAGLILAEGAGICVMEEYEHALARGATIYAELVGYGQTNDANGFVAPSSDGTHYARAFHQALQDGQLTPADVAYVQLDGRAIPSSDQGEAHALHLIFGEDTAHLPVSVPRTMLGHSYAAAGALDTITAVLALHHGLLPPTINCEELNPCYGLDLVRDEARPLCSALNGQEPQVALVSGRGIGGANVVLALKEVR
jgi:3-oxoacyl-(acyl-carrier-protein) synthase